MKGFNHLIAATLAADPIVEGGHRVVFLSSDDEDATAPVAALTKQLGFAPVKLGKLNGGGALRTHCARTWGQPWLPGSVQEGAVIGVWALFEDRGQTPGRAADLRVTDIRSTAIDGSGSARVSPTILILPPRAFSPSLPLDRPWKPMRIMQLERLMARTSLMMRLTIADCFTPMSVIEQSVS